MTRIKKEKIFLLGGVLVSTLFLLYLIQNQALRLDSEEIKNFVTSFGILGPLVFIFLFVVTIIISPLVSFPFWFAGLALFGLWSTTFYIILSNGLGSAINFALARYWGRPVVAKLAGKKALKEIDKLTEVAGLETLLAVRFFGGALMDYISYAAGLTSMRFKPYFLISLLAPIPVSVLKAYLFEKAYFSKPILTAYLTFLAIWAYFLAFAIPWWAYKRKKKV